MIEKLYEVLRAIDDIDALALGGSRASDNDDNKSDYDLYVYSEEIIPNDVREKAIKPLCERAEIGNRYFENEDNIVLTDGTFVDIIYRRISDFEKWFPKIISGEAARNGYSTCFWHNIRTSRIIFDKSGRFGKLYDDAQCEYPKALKEAIIKRNMALLSGYLPSYDKQIKKAFYRSDYVSVNHRVAAFLESYFDVIFAVNEMTHPGEKRLIQICRSKCSRLPKNFEENLIKLFEYMFQYDVSDILENMINELEKII